MTARAQKEYMDYCEITQGYYNTGKEDGYKQGEEHAKLENAQNMILTNLGTLEQIARCTGLPLEKVRELATELQAKA